MTKVNSLQRSIMPYEAPVAIAGIATAATANLGIQFLRSYAAYRLDLPNIVKNFAFYGCSALSLAGSVAAVYSAIRLCQRILNKENTASQAIKATALGALLTAIIHTIGEHFWKIAPSFNWLAGRSIAYCIGTNFAWQLCMITGVAGLAFTAYAAYRAGKAVLDARQPAIVSPTKA